MKARFQIVGFAVVVLLLVSLALRASGIVGTESFYASSNTGGAVGGVVFADEDVLALDRAVGQWSIHMDGSDLGINASQKVDGFHVRSDGSVLFSLTLAQTLPGVGPVDDSDVVEFTPTSTGSNTAGSLSLYFDGSAHGLSSNGEDVDAVALTPGGDLLISTMGNGWVDGAVADEDILVFNGTDLSLFLDGSAVGLNSTSEDVVGVSAAPNGDIRLTTLGNFTVNGTSGDRSDAITCRPTSTGPITSCDWSQYWDGDINGFGSETLNGLSIGDAAEPPPTTTTLPATTLPATTLPATTIPTTTAPPTTTTVPPPVIAGSAIYAVSTTGGEVGQVSFADEDLLRFDAVTGEWSIYIDGSDLGIASSQKIDGFHVRPDGSVLFSLTAPGVLPGIGAFDDSDVIDFVPTSVGSTTAGSISMYFDGSAYGLSTAAEDIDAVALAPNGQLLISVLGNASAGFGTASDEDVLIFDGNNLALYLDGSAVDLGGSSEDVVGISVDPSGIIYLTTAGNYNTPGASGQRSDVLQCIPVDELPITDCDWSTYWRGSSAGFQNETANGLSITGAVTYFSDFDQPLGPEWRVYNSIGHAGWGLRRPSAIDVVSDTEALTGGSLLITAKMGSGSESGQLVSGGMKLRLPQTYGRYTVRMKTEADPDEVTSGVALLWPESNQWPRDGEIDIVETYDARATRTPVESTLHWLNPAATEPYTPADDAKSLHDHVGVDGTEWHTFILEWRADIISVSVDGGTPLVLTTDPAEIPDWNMEPTLQLDAFDSPDAPGLQPTLSAPVRMTVDYILVQP